MRIVTAAVLLQGRDRAERDRDKIRDDDRQDADFERDREARGDLVQDRFSRPHRNAEIAAEKSPHEIDELQEHRAIEPELVMTGLDGALIKSTAAGAEPHYA